METSMHTAVGRAAFELLAGTSLTTYPVDNARAVAIVRAFNGDPDAIAEVLRKRALYREWLTVTQRRWQRETRNPNKARHHDSISTREKYVRCGR